MGKIMSAPRILLVEDEMLIAMDIESRLRDDGFDVAGPFATAQDAMENLDGPDIAAALLDINLRGGRSFDLAKEIIGRKIPPIFMSGAVDPDLPADLSACPISETPRNSSKLLATLRSEIAKSAA
jgi:DNA-binding NtrC family response regulator